MLFARNLETVRLDHGFSFATYANILGVSESTLRRASTRTKKNTPYNPSLSTVLKASKAFGIDVDTVLNRRVENLV